MLAADRPSKSNSRARAAAGQNSLSPAPATSSANAAAADLVQQARAEEQDEDEEEEEEDEMGESRAGMDVGDGELEGDEDKIETDSQAAQAQEYEAGMDERPVDEEMYDTESPSDSGTDSLTWITWFCSLPGHEYFAEVAEDFIEDDFNLTGLNALVPYYKEALEMILDVEPQEESLKIPDVSIVESSAELLYGLIHQRYILTRTGLQQMVEKYEGGHFGYCPRVFCHSQPVLPCGRSDLPGLDTVKLFCPNCIDNYAPPSSRYHGVDGAFFGTTFPHLLFQCYRDLAPSPIAPVGSNAASLNLSYVPPSTGSAGQSNADEDDDAARRGSSRRSQRANSASSVQPSTILPTQLGLRTPQARVYTPRIYGFRVSEHAKSGPRMRWMRMRPENFEEFETGSAPGSKAREVTPAAPARQSNDMAITTEESAG